MQFRKCNLCSATASKIILIACKRFYSHNILNNICVKKVKYRLAFQQQIFNLFILFILSYHKSHYRKSKDEKYHLLLHLRSVNSAGCLENWPLISRIQTTDTVALFLEADG